MRTGLSNRLFSDLSARGVGRFVILNLLRSDGKRAAEIAAGEGESAAADYLASRAQRARETMPRYRRQRKAQFARWAAQVKRECGGFVSAKVNTF